MSRILVTDDDAVIRKGLKRFLEEEHELKIKVDTCSGQDALAKIKRERPDMVILDPRLSGVDGFGMLEQLAASRPPVPVLVYTHDRSGDLGLMAIRMGAAGYATKDCPWEELVVGVKKILAGRRFLTDSLVERLAAETQHPSAASILQKLPKREAQILRLIVVGHSIKEIASKLLLVSSTVSTYRARLLNKFGFRTNAELVRFATENTLFLNREKDFLQSSKATTKL